MDEQRIIAYLRSELPALLAIYLFGSQASGQAGAGSDADLAVLVEGKADPLRLWELGQSLASLLNIDVDLVDLRAASTVMQYQIITTGRRIWERDMQAALYETFILSEKTALDTANAGWIEASLAESLKRIVGFRNIAVHGYQAIQLPITVTIIEKHLDEFIDFTRQVLRPR